MISTRMNLAVVGAFVLAGLLTLVYVLAVLAGRTGSTESYYTVYSNVTGLKFGSQVFYEGYPIGQVTEIAPRPADGHMAFRVTLAVTAGWQIPEDSIARSSSSGLLAPQVISIAAGQSPTALKPGAMIAAGQGADLFSTVAGAAGSVNRLTNDSLLPMLQHLDQQIDTIGRLLDVDVRKLVGNANVVAAAAAQDVPLVLRDARTATRGLADLSTQAQGLLTPERVAGLGRIIDNADRASASLAKTTAALESVSSDSGEDLRVSLRELRLSSESLSRHADSIARNLDSTTRNLQELSQRLKQNPGLLIRGGGSEDPEDKP